MKKLKGCSLPMAFDLPPMRLWGLRHIPIGGLSAKYTTLTTAHSNILRAVHDHPNVEICDPRHSSMSTGELDCSHGAGIVPRPCGYENGRHTATKSMKEEQ
jgi:hypothetical protein